MDPVLFPDTVTLSVDYLAEQLVDAGYDTPVVSAVPNPRPAEFVHLYRLGGPRNTPVSDRAQIAVDTWGDDDIAAHDLAQIARAHIVAMYGQVVAGVQVYRVDELSGPSSLPDPESGQARYSFQVAVMVRGTPLPAGS